MIVINLFAGPGAGKSSVAAGLFSKLKEKSFNCELITEVSKDLVWDESYSALQFQPYVFGQQAWRMERLRAKVDAIITDSPILLAMIYAKSMPSCFYELVKWQHDQFENYNFFLNRNPNTFQDLGRVHTKEESIRLDNEIKLMLDNLNYKYSNVNVNENAVSSILSEIKL
jgi:nicotinamide riboside kinase